MGDDAGYVMDLLSAAVAEIPRQCSTCLGCEAGSAECHGADLWRWHGLELTARGRHFTAPPREDLVRLYDDGWNTLQLAELYGVAHSTVSNWLHRLGVEKLRNVHDYPLSDRQKESIRLLSTRPRGPLSEATKAKISRALRRGDSPRRWIDRNGYAQIYAPEHPDARADGCVPEHRLVMERKIGRRLRPDEAVHHINRSRTDNRPENLQLMDAREHALMHIREAHAAQRKKEGGG